MLIAWTTVETREAAERLAREIIEHRLAACAQVEGPITSYYRWRNKVEMSSEFRLMLKFLPEQAKTLASWTLAHHPYETPEWVVVKAADVGKKYLSWAKANATNPPL